MPDYVPVGTGTPVTSSNGNEYFLDAAKQTPGSLPDNAYDRTGSPTAFTIFKTPNAIIVSSNVTADLGFYFNSSSFATKAAAEGGPGVTTYSGSAGYSQYNHLPAGTYNIHPIAVSGSAADVAKINLIYKSGLSTGGF